MGQAAALSGLIGLIGPLAIVLKPPPVTWLGLISANIGYFISAPFLSTTMQRDSRTWSGVTLWLFPNHLEQRRHAQLPGSPIFFEPSGAADVHVGVANGKI